MPNIGPTELIIVLVIALVILGPKRLPAAGRSLGRGIREFKDGTAGRDAADSEITATTQTAPIVAGAQSPASLHAARETKPETQRGGPVS